MTGRAWMALLGLIVIAFVLASCSPDNTRSDNGSTYTPGYASGYAYAGGLTCDQYRGLENGCAPQVVNQTLEVCETYNPSICYQVSATEWQDGAINNPCGGQPLALNLRPEMRWDRFHAAHAPLPPRFGQFGPQRPHFRH